MLLKGQVTPPDHERAFRWFFGAAEQGLAEAQLQLGDFYSARLGIPEDQATAAAWYEKAAAQGNRRAAARLSMPPEAQSAGFKSTQHRPISAASARNE
jgi:TPR repeat protein